MVDLGFNYRLPDIQCALGLSQLAKLDRFLARRTAIAERYRRELSAVPGVLMPAVAADVTHAWHIFAILLDPERVGVGRAEVFGALRAEGIGVTVHYIPVYRHPYYQRLGYPTAMCPVAESAHERLLTLPLSARMLDSDVADVVAAVSKVLRHFTR
jgi:dTDP-4-amino-4,6-dideoxygalactose transaminase